MSTVVKPFIDNLDRVKNELTDIAKSIILEHKEEIISIVQDTQLGKGFDSYGKYLIHPKKRSGKRAGKRIGTYEDSTEKIYKREGANKPKVYGEYYNFNWSGATFDGMDIKKYTKDEYTIFSKDFKASILKSQYKTELFNLTDENNDWVNNNIIAPKLYKYILEETFKDLI